MCFREVDGTLMMLVLAVALLLVAAGAASASHAVKQLHLDERHLHQEPQLGKQYWWVGMSPEPNNPRNVSLFELGINGRRVKDMAQVLLLNPNEHVAVDAFRCMPYGDFCAFLTSNGTSSWLYNVSMPSGAENSRTELPGVSAHNLHLDTANNAAYTVALRPRKAVVLRVLPGDVKAVVDISEHLGAHRNGTIAPGSSTQCSNKHMMWIGIRRSAFGEKDIIVHIDAFKGEILGTSELSDPLVTSMWALCYSASGIIVGGTMPLNNGVDAAYGEYNQLGHFVPHNTALIPTNDPPLRMTALLSQPPVYNFFIAMYPEGSEPGGPQVGGFLGFGNFNRASKPSPIKFVPIDYYLTGAARLR